MHLAALAAITSVLVPPEAHAATNGFQMQTIVLPAVGGWSRFVDLDGGGRADLIALNPRDSQLVIFHQTTSGFPGTPSQTLKLPPQTAWITAKDVDPAHGVELVMSTAAGLSYFRQGKDGFESEPFVLIKAEQVLTNQDSPPYVSLPTNGSLPIIAATQAVLYSNTNGDGWRAGEPMPLQVQGGSWYSERNGWTAGPNSARTLQIHEPVMARRAKPDTNEFENASIKKLVGDLNKSSARHLQETTRLDLNGDKRRDLVIWDFFPGLEPRTDIYIFLRGEDGKLPERPTQLLHCRGMPVPTGSTQQPSPFVDLNGDGTYELVLVDLATTLTSASSIVDMVLSGGLECSLNVRVFSRGGFSTGPTATVSIRTIMPVTTLAPVDEMMEWPFFIHGDFNGDGRPDVVVRRSSTQWSILFSTKDDRWFAPVPAMTFETPVQGSLEIRDLNGDGLADIVLRPDNDPRIFIFLNQMHRKGARP
jgi:hypothetical protein